MPILNTEAIQHVVVMCNTTAQHEATDLFAAVEFHFQEGPEQSGSITILYMKSNKKGYLEFPAYPVHAGGEIHWFRAIDGSLMESLTEKAKLCLLTIKAKHGDRVAGKIFRLEFQDGKKIPVLQEITAAVAANP